MGQVNVLQAFAGGAALVGNGIRYERLKLAQQDVRDANADLNDLRKNYDDYLTTHTTSTVPPFDPYVAAKAQQEIDDQIIEVNRAQRAYDAIGEEEALWQAGAGAAELGVGLGYGGAGDNGTGGGGNAGDAGSNNSDWVAPALLGAAAGFGVAEVIDNSNTSLVDTRSSKRRVIP